MGTHLLEERYRMLETNFKAIVAELKARPSSLRQSAELEALLSTLDSDVRHAMLRAHAASLAAHQRLEERTAILQKNFARIVEMLREPPDHIPFYPHPSPNASLTSGCGVSATSQVASIAWHPWSGDSAAGASVAGRPAAFQRPCSLSIDASDLSGAKLGSTPQYDTCHLSATLDSSHGGLRVDDSKAPASAVASSFAVTSVVDFDELDTKVASSAAELDEQELKGVPTKSASEEEESRLTLWQLRQQKVDDELLAEGAVSSAKAEEVRFLLSNPLFPEGLRERTCPASKADTDAPLHLQLAFQQRELVARLEASEHALARLQQANARVPELEAEIESLRSAERYANLQAQMQSRRAEESVREVALLQGHLASLSSLPVPPGTPIARELQPLTGTLPTAANGFPASTGQSAASIAVPSLLSEEAGAATELSTTPVDDLACTSLTRTPQPAATNAATSAAAPPSITSAGGVATTGAAVGSDICVGAFSTTTTPLAIAPPTPTAIAPPPLADPTPTLGPTSGSALSAPTPRVGAFFERRVQRQWRALVGAQTRALIHSQVFQATHIAHCTPWQNAALAQAVTFVQYRGPTCEEQDVVGGTPSRLACWHGNERIPSTEQANGENVLRALLPGEPRSAEIDSRQGDLQFVRRGLHSVKQELASYRTRTATIRFLLGQLVRKQCREQVREQDIAIALLPSSNRNAHPVIDVAAVHGPSHSLANEGLLQLASLATDNVREAIGDSGGAAFLDEGVVDQEFDAFDGIQDRDANIWVESNGGSVSPIASSYPELPFVMPDRTGGPDSTILAADTTTASLNDHALI